MYCIYRYQGDDIRPPDYLRVSNGANDDSIILPEDIKEKIPEEKTAEQILGELDSLVGMENIKTEVRNLINTIKVQKERAEKLGETYKLGIHIVMTGNPGTGKTTVARKLGEIFQAIGLLDRGHLVEVDRSKMVAQYVGQTAPQVNTLCDSAMGGILFIDEAYTLAPRGMGADYGKEAIDTLLKRMEDDRGKFVVIVAGYPELMEDFINTNPGLKSRFTKYIDFEDYKPEELKAIFKLMAKNKGMILGEEVEEFLARLFEDIYEKRDENFANGRTVRNIFEMVLQNQSNRIAEMMAKGEIKPEALNTITVEDLKTINL